MKALFARTESYRGHPILAAGDSQITLRIPPAVLTRNTARGYSVPVAPVTRHLAILGVVLFGLGASSSSQSEIDSILVRVATWNIETVGAPGSTEYEAAHDVLSRIGADIVAINKVASSADAANLSPLAADAGYASVVVPSSNPFGADRNARLPGAHSSPEAERPHPESSLRFPLPGPAWEFSS